MVSKKLAIAVAAGISLLLAAPAFAQPPRWSPAHGWRAHDHDPRFGHRIVVVHPPYRVYVPLPPVIVYRQPAYVVYPPAPANPDPRLRIRLRF